VSSTPRVTEYMITNGTCALCFSAVLYNLSKTVAHVLSLPLALHHTLAPRPARLKDDELDSHKYDNVPPELALLVAVIVVLKMVYGLDGQPRYVSKLRQPQVQALRWCRSGLLRIALIRGVLFLG
jgi:hypothetical protein